MKYSNPVETGALRTLIIAGVGDVSVTDAQQLEHEYSHNPQEYRVKILSCHRLRHFYQIFVQMDPRRLGGIRGK